MKATPSSVSTATKAIEPEAKPSVQVLNPGKRRIVGGTKFGKDGCGY